MDIQTFLEWLVAHPGSLDGGTLLGFASVDYTNTAEVDAAVAAGGAALDRDQRASRAADPVR